MKVYMGPYPGRCTVIDISSWLLEKRHKKPYYMVKESEMNGFDKAHENFFTFVQLILNKTINKWFFDKRKRKIAVRIDRYDTWGMDHSLAHIIHPMLLQLKETKHGAPYVDDEDVPEHLRSTAAPPKENDYDTDENHFKRWDWVLDEMIWTFECDLDEDWENQFHSGKFDYTWVEAGEFEGEKTYKMEHGPNHTHVFDKEAYDKAWDRRRNAMRLFGKYYHNLWD